MRSTQIHKAFDVLTRLFDLVGLRTNVGKTVIMTCQPYCAIWEHSAEAYSIRMTVEDLNYQERLLQWVCLPECDTNLA